MAPNYKLFVFSLALVMSPPSVYARVFLGSSEDDYNRTNIEFYTPRPITDTERGLVLGFPGSPRIVIPLPEAQITTVIPQSSRLKDEFLRELRTCSKDLRANDTLFIAFCSHGRETDGQYVEAALKGAQKSARVIIWLGSCHSGFWLNSTKWITIAAARRLQESYSVPQSTSGHLGGSRHTLATFTALGKPNNGIYSCPGSDTCFLTQNSPPQLQASKPIGIRDLAQATDTIIRASYPLPGFPHFSHAALERLHFYPAGEIPQKDPEFTATASTSDSSSSRLDTLRRTFSDGVRSGTYPNTPSMNKLILLVGRLATIDKNPDLVMHAIAYHETVQFLAKSLYHTGVWKKRITNEVISGRKAVDLLESKCGEEAIQEMWSILKVNDHPQLEWFKWTTTTLQSYADVWVECGAPAFNGDDLRSARAQVLEWIDGVGRPNRSCDAR
ncbi:hypothetical protein BT96DRAFT_1021745 [Gymnopus androsaceus JB14]|uniref:Peptidase C14 n=1 Tax=Gymnopus androsaceus JB14 TaxID=1447944 RepID=A0A6A4HDF5_9AGAR|nr:hypothetical protein BT96DRAFT_1021745 [Gymnopus androsaceus JB14]